MGDFTWVEKEPMQTFSGKVTGINYVASKTEGENTAFSGGAEAFGPAEIKEASYWTQAKIDAQAEAFRIRNDLDAELDAQLATMDDDEEDE